MARTSAKVRAELEADALVRQAAALEKATTSEKARRAEPSFITGRDKFLTGFRGTDIIERLQSGRRWDLDLDEEVGELLSWALVTIKNWKLTPLGPDAGGQNACEIYTPNGKLFEDFGYPGGNLDPFYHVSVGFRPEFTHTLQASIDVVEDLLGWNWSIERAPQWSIASCHRERHADHPWGKGKDHVGSNATTPERAMTLSLLRGAEKVLRGPWEGEQL